MVVVVEVVVVAVVVAVVVLLSRFPFGFWKDTQCVCVCVCVCVCGLCVLDEPLWETGALHRCTKGKPPLRITQPAEPSSKMNDQISPRTTYTTTRDNSSEALEKKQ